MAAFTCAYSYKVPGLYKTPAEVAGAICQQLSESEAGLSPTTLLDASREPNAPLHGEFEWRDDVAAEKYRLNQAQRLIQNIVITTKRQDGSDVSDRSFVLKPGGTSQYTPIQSALSREDWKDFLLETARCELKAFSAKYRRLKELSSVTEAIDTFLREDVG